MRISIRFVTCLEHYVRQVGAMDNSVKAGFTSNMQKGNYSGQRGRR